MNSALAAVLNLRLTLAWAGSRWPSSREAPGLDRPEGQAGGHQSPPAPAELAEYLQEQASR